MISLPVRTGKAARRLVPIKNSRHAGEGTRGHRPSHRPVMGPTRCVSRQWRDDLGSGAPAAPPRSRGAMIVPGIRVSGRLCRRTVVTPAQTVDRGVHDGRPGGGAQARTDTAAAVRTPNQGGPTRDSGRTGYPGNTDPALPCGAEEQSKESTVTYSQTVADDYPSSSASVDSPHPEMRRPPHHGTGERAGPARRRRSGTVVVTRRHASARDGGRAPRRTAGGARTGSALPPPHRRVESGHAFAGSQQRWPRWWLRTTGMPGSETSRRAGGWLCERSDTARQGTVCDEHRVRAALALPATVCISWSESSGETVRASPLPRCLQ